MSIFKIIVRFHFIFLYVAFYSALRYGFGQNSEIGEKVLSFFAVSLFAWFILANLILFLADYRGGYSRKDYLSTYVLSITAIVIVLLEYFVYE